MWPTCLLHIISMYVLVQLSRYQESTVYRIKCTVNRMMTIRIERLQMCCLLVHLVTVMPLNPTDNDQHLTLVFPLLKRVVFLN